MDSNVSKETFLHKFFKLRFSSEQTSLSAQELLQHALLSALDLSQPSCNFHRNPQFSPDTIRSRIVLLYSSIESISSNRHKDRFLLSLQPIPIVYASSIALVLASRIAKKPQIIAQELVDLLILPTDNIDVRFDTNVYIKINQSGAIYFYLDCRSIAVWLDKSSALLHSKPTYDWQNLSSPLPLGQNLAILFPAQYVHARCCTLLRLGAREKLNIDVDSSPSSWLDNQNNLWLAKEIELLLLRQLFLVTDSFASDSANWVKLALNLSKTVAVFGTECRFLGEIKQNNPEKAIARLRLIALSQYWLQRILVEKLNVAAPTSL